MKASAFRRWPVAGAYSPEQTTRLTGGSDYIGMMYLTIQSYRSIFCYHLPLVCSGYGGPGL